MNSETTSEARRRQLEDLIKSYETAEDPERQLLNLVIASAGAGDPELSNLITSCAIPRYFDAEIIGVLRQAPGERQANETFFSKLAQLSFTRSRSDGRCSYADSTREILLEQWRDPARKDLFDELNQRLAAYHQQNYEKVERLERDLVLTAPAVRRANPARLVQLTTQLERRMIEPLLEALYHKSLQSAEVAYGFFETAIFTQESQRRLTICEILRITTLAYVRQSPAGDEQTRLLAWLTYWEGRLARQSRQYQQAERIFRQLLPQTDIDVRLKLWTWGDLAGTLAAQSQNRDARDTYQQLITYAEASGSDPYNLPTWYLSLASHHWSLEELELAAEKYREAISRATNRNIGTEIAARIELSGVLYGMGEWPEAIDLALEAHHLARTRLGNDRGIFRNVINQLETLMSRRDARLLDTLAAESEESTAADSKDPSIPLQVRQRYFTLLRYGGQLTRADELLTNIWADLWANADEVTKSSLLLEKALLREAQGRFDEVLALYDELIQVSEGLSDAAYYHAAALSNRGMIRSKTGKWQEAESDFRLALGEWQEGLNEKFSGLIKATMATAQRLQGKLDQAQDTLDEAGDLFKEAASPYRSGYLVEQGDLFAAKGLRDQARRIYLEALEFDKPRDNFQSAATVLGKLTKLAAEEGKWSEAEGFSGESQRFWKKLSDLDSYRRSEAALLADAENASGIQAFFVSDEQRNDRILKARLSFLKASELVPDNFWYQLNLSYACAELGEWEGAAAAILKVLANSPTWLHAPKLYERLKDYRLAQGEKLFASGFFKEAAHVYSESMVELGGQLKDDSRSELELRLGDSRLKLGELNNAETSYTNGIKITLEGDCPTYKTIFPARLGFVRALQLDLAGAVEHFKNSIDQHEQLKSPNPVADVVVTVEAFADLLITSDQFRVAGEALRLLTANPPHASEQANRLIEARLSLSQNRYQALRRPTKESTRAAAATDIPVTTPIMLQADARLFPEDDQSGTIERLINSDLPNVREQVLKSTGVIIPGVKVRAEEAFPTGQYFISLFEIPFESGFVIDGKTFCADAKVCRELGLDGEIAMTPAGSGKGMWLDQPLAEKARLAGLQLYDPYQFMVSHLQSVVHRHLDCFLGTQEVQNLIDQWQAEANGERKALTETALPDHDSMVRLVQVFQSLAKENVPVKNLSAIITSFANANSQFSELSQVVEAVRFSLRSELPDSRPGVRFFSLPTELEDEVARLIHSTDGKQFLVLKPQERTSLIDAVTNEVQAFGDVIVVVQTEGLRRFVRRLLQEKFPQVSVLAASELAASTTSTSTANNGVRV